MLTDVEKRVLIASTRRGDRLDQQLCVSPVWYRPQTGEGEDGRGLVRERLNEMG
jgi:hypothetical protein